MCGIAGAWDSSCPTELVGKIVENMTRVLTHRGPDGQGMWSENRAGFAIGHRRLSVLDLSSEGQQPMVSGKRRYVMSYNGEIYNCDELRASLGPLHTFRGHSDTEVALAYIERFGLSEAVKQFNGMFAFALWDRDEHSLALVRDRMGIKPLYYGRTAKALLFASQPGALRQHPQFAPSLSPQAMAQYFQSSYVPAPYCIYRNAHKVMPGTILRFSAADAVPKVEQYWDPHAIAVQGQRNNSRVSTNSQVEELDTLLTDSVARRLVADVPVGAFLSGGIDSSTVVALMCKQSSQVKTFTIGSQESSHDESCDARAIATHLGTEHTELIATADDALAVVEQLGVYYDEPFADSSQIPTLLVSRLAREHVTVSLSGDGGDELFGGYNRHIWAPRIGKINSKLPHAMRAAFAKSLAFVRPENLDWIYQHFLRHFLQMRLPSDKAIKMARALASADNAAMYNVLANNNAVPQDLLHPDFYRPPTPVPLADLDIAHQFMFADMTRYLPDDILCKVDRASMAVSLEARVPLLDHRVVEFAWKLGMDQKVVNGQGKWLLRKVLDKYVPRPLLDRPKSGFGIPMGQWLRGPLKQWGQELILGPALEATGMFQCEAIRKRWQQHQQGKTNEQQHLWDVLTFLQWHSTAFA